MIRAFNNKNKLVQNYARSVKNMRLFTNHQPPKATTNGASNGAANGASAANGAKSANGGSKPPVDAQQTGKKSLFPWFTLSILTTIGSFSYLAIKVEEEDPVALHIYDQPIVKHIVPAFITLVNFAGLVTPKPPAVVTKPQTTPYSTPEANRSLSFDYNVEPVKDEALASSGDEPESPVGISHHVVQVEAEQVVEQVEYSSKEPDVETVPSVAAEVENNVENPAKLIEYLDEAPTSDESTTVESRDTLENPITTFELHHHQIETSAEVSDAEGELGYALPPVTSELTFRQASRSTSDSAGEVLTNVSRNSIALRKELESVLLKDIHTLDAPALRLRITQLVGELFERLSWESIRISQAVITVENELQEKYKILMAKQREELEFEINKILFDREKTVAKLTEEKVKEYEVKYQDDLTRAIKAQAEGFQKTLNTELTQQAEKIQAELQAQMDNYVVMLKKEHTDQLVNLTPSVDRLEKQFRAINDVIDATKDSINHTFNSHAISSALLALDLLLSNPIKANELQKQKHLEENLKKLKSLAKSDQLISAIIDSLPNNVQKHGALSLSELQVRFQVMREEVRKVALAPENAPKIVGQVIGSILAAISIEPKGYITGQGIDETLARAAYKLERGQLKECLDELEGVNGYARVLMNDWKTSATERLVVDQALEALKAESMIRHQTFKK